MRNRLGNVVAASKQHRALQQRRPNEDFAEQDQNTEGDPPSEQQPAAATEGQTPMVLVTPGLPHSVPAITPAPALTLAPELALAIAAAPALASASAPASASALAPARL